MATVESHSHRPEHEAPPVPSDAMALDTSINGHTKYHSVAVQNNNNNTSSTRAAVRHNDIPAFSYDSLAQSSLPQDTTTTSFLTTSGTSTPAKAAQEQLSQVATGLTPTAPDLDTPSMKPVSSIPTPASSFQVADNTTPASTQQEPAPTSMEHSSPKGETQAAPPSQLDTNGDAPMAVPDSAFIEEDKGVQESGPERTPPSATSIAQLQQTEFVASSQAVAEPKAAEDQEMADVSQTTTKIVREREEDEDAEPVAKRTKTEDESAILGAEASPILPTTEVSRPGTAEEQSDVPVNGATSNGSLATPAASAIMPTAEEWGPMTDAQVKGLKQALANMKKGRFASSFSKPVDPITLNIPTYFDIVKQPMDLTTVDSKLKDGKYGSVHDFVADFDLIVDNCIKFNGPNHLISVQGQNLRAQFQAGLRRVPKAGEVAPSPQLQLKKQRSSISLPARDVKVRSSRPSLPNEATETFALGANGIPLARRTSGTDGRPKREIHRPPPRDLPYLSAKPKKKKYQMELKFCEHVLSELKKGRYAHLMTPFAAPVDPVALNIPQYHKIVKKPMDFGTITDRLSGGQYENAKEFETEVNLVFENCFKFNGMQHPISQIAKQFHDIFADEWSHKNSWIAHNAPSSAPQSPEAESDSGGYDEDDVEDEEEAEEARKAAELKAIHEQMAALNAKAMELSNLGINAKKSKPTKKSSKIVKGGGSKSTQRKSGPVSVSRPVEKKVSKAKAKPAKPLNKKEEQEICNRMGELTGDETNQVYTWIQDGRRGEGRDPLPESPEGAIELTLEAIPNPILHRILDLIHSHDPQSDYRPVSSASTARHAPAPHKKKHKPMRMNEQTAAIQRVESQLASFDNQGLRTPSDSPTGPPGYGGDGSDDDDDSGSESEEE